MKTFVAALQAAVLAAIVALAFGLPTTAMAEAHHHHSWGPAAAAKPKRPPQRTPTTHKLRKPAIKGAAKGPPKGRGR